MSHCIKSFFFCQRLQIRHEVIRHINTDHIDHDKQDSNKTQLIMNVI